MRQNHVLAALEHARAILGRDGVRPLLGEAFTQTDTDYLDLVIANTSTAPRRLPPTWRTASSEPQGFRAWVEQPTYQEDKLPWKCVAAFYYLGECLDYIAKCQDTGADVVFQSPAGVKLFEHDGPRAVFAAGGMPAATQANCNAATGC